MKRLWQSGVTLSVLVLGLIFGLTQASAANTIVYPVETNEILHGNPNAGMIFEPNWTYNDDGMTHLINNRTIPAETDLVQIYFGWSDIEPTDDQFVWTRLDAAISSAVSQGRKVIFRMEFSEGDESPRQTYAPTWLWDVKGIPYRLINENPLLKQPYYYDPTYLAELQEAVAAVGARYDGNPDIAYVDLAAVARCGEWGGWDNADWFPWQSRTQQRETLEAIIDIFDNAFPNSRLIMHDAGQIVEGTPDEQTNEQRKYHWAYDYAFDNHPDWGIRSNTVFGAWDWNLYGSEFTPWLMRNSWRNHLVVYEGSRWDSDFYMLSNKQRYVDNSLGIHTNIGTFNNAGYEAYDDGGLMAEWNGYFQQLARNVGYRFVLSKAMYNDKVEPSGTFTLSQTWINKGVGRLIDKHPLKVYFVNAANGDVVWSAADNGFDQTHWEKWNVYELNSTFNLPANLPHGTYDLKVAMVDGAGNPAIAMPMTDGENKMYRIGTVTVAANEDAYTAPSLGGFVKVEVEDTTNYSGFEIMTNCALNVKHCIGYSDTGDWAEYDYVEIPHSGVYTVDFRVSTGAQQSFKLQVDGADVTDVITPPVSSGNYVIVSRNVNLSAGRHTVKLIMTDAGGAINFDWFAFTKQDPDDFVIQNEDYTAKSASPLIITIDDLDGTAGIGFNQTGEWLSYGDVQVPQTGTYLAEFRVATSLPQQSFRLEVDGTDVTGTIVMDNMEGHNNWTTVTKAINLTQGTHTFKFVLVQAGGGINLNWMKFTKQEPFEKTIEAEDFTRPSADASGETNIQVMTINDGGTAAGIGYIDTDDNLEYDSVYIPRRGMYRIDFRVQTTWIQSFRLEVDGVDATGTITPPNANGSWITVSKTILLTEGSHKFRLYFTDAGGNINYNWMKITAV